MLVTGKETDNAFAVVGSSGTFDKPIGFHLHREAHDVFLCFNGKLNIWVNDTARSLGPGDFASVSPVCTPAFESKLGLYANIMLIGHNPSISNRL